MFLSVDNISSFADRVFTIVYDPNVLSSPNLIHQSNVTVISATRGEVAFTVNTVVQENTVWSGVLVVANFNALATVRTTVTFTINLPPEQRENAVRFHFDGIYVDVPITLGEPIHPSLIPIPATRYGRPDTPGQAFMGWFTISAPDFRIIIAPEHRPVAFDLRSPITEAMIGNDGMFHLYGSWLQYGDVDGDGRVSMMDFNRFQRFMLGAIDYDEIIPQTADVNVDGRVNAVDLNMLQRFMLGELVILGVPEP